MQENKKDNNFQQIEKKYDKAFAKVILKLAEQKETIPFVYFLTNKLKVNDPKKIQEDYKKIIESKIFRYCEFFAVAQYLYMQKTGAWTEAGKDRVLSAMCYLFFDLNVQDDIGFDKYSKLEEKINELASIYKLNEYDENKLKGIISVPKIRVLGREIYYSETALLNKILAIMGSPCRIIMGKSGEYITMIFGIATSKKFDKYSIYFMEKEIMRTPNAVHYIVGVIDQDQIAIRREVCEYIFYKKWLYAYEEDEAYSMFFEKDEVSEISNSLKKATFNSFGVKTKAEVEEAKDAFLDSMTESLAYHEIAHDALEASNFTLNEICVSEGSVLIGENILSIMNEILTEWMPGEDLFIKGPMKNICDKAFSASNTKEAEQMLFIYLSDAWFLDTDTQFMYSYTYIMFTMMSKYLLDDFEVDFASLYSDLNNIYDFLSKWHRSIVSELMMLLKNHVYVKQPGEKDFNSFYNAIKGLMQIANSLDKKDLDERQTESQIWINVFLQIKSLYPDLVKKITELFETQEKLFYKELILKFGGKKNSDKYGTDISRYVIDSMKDKGVIPHETQDVLQDSSS